MSAIGGSLVDRSSRVHMRNYGTPLGALVRGKGVRVWDEDGVEYIDLLAGIAVNALGHAHPAVVDAVTLQISTLGHASNFFGTQPCIELAEHLLALFEPEGRVFFSNSGAEANEAAFKISRLTGRTRLVSTTGAFHGRTMGALALTGQPAKSDPFRPLPGDVTFVEYGDASAIVAAIDDTVAAVVVEPIQGESGVVVPPVGYLTAIEDACTKHGALFVVDEVQTGLGRTGRWWDHEYEDVHPDVVTSAKGLGGGLPIGATIAFGDAAELFAPGSHGSTFGGNPVACAAALAVLNTIAKDDLVAHALERGDQLEKEITELASSLVASVRGRGLLRAVELTRPVAAMVEKSARAHGVIVNAPTPTCLRIAPPLVLSQADCSAAIERLGEALDHVASHVSEAAP